MIILRVPLSGHARRAVAAAALLEQEVGKVEVLLFLRHLVELHQRQFNLLVAGHPVGLARTEEGHHVVSHPPAHVEQFALARSLVVGHSGLNHVAGAIHFVLIHVGPPVVEPRKRVERVDISVGPLCSGNLVNPFIRLGLQLSIAMIGQGVGHTFECLVHVRVVEEDARVLASSLSRPLEVAHAPRLVLNLVDADGQGSLAVLEQARRPELIGNLYVREVNLVNHLQVLLGPSRQGTHQQGSKE